MDTILAERSNPLKCEQVLNIEEQADDYAHIETISVDENGGAIVKFVIDDPVAYDGLVQQHADIVSKGTVYDVR